MGADVFPNTLVTWIGDRLDGGPEARLDLNAYLMATYSEPLAVYFRGTDCRWLGEPEDIVAGFFADRLGRSDFLPKWRESDLRLRRWLMNGFCFYLHELKRLRRRDATQTDGADEPVSFAGDPDSAMDRAAVLAFVGAALDEAREVCRAGGLEKHWEIFLRHHLDGVPFAALAGDHGVDAARAAVMSRTAARKFRAALENVLVRDGVSPGEVHCEIEILLEATG